MKTLLLVVILFSLTTWSQNQEFTVLTSKGEVKVKRLAGSWQPLSIGAKLFKGEIIKLSKNNYLGLLHSTGKTKELKNEGVFNVSDLAGSFDSQKASVSAKFAGYLLDEFMNKDDTKKEMENLGAVVRQGIERIELDFPKNTLIMDSTIQFAWFPRERGEKYIFQIINGAKNTVFMKEISDSFIVIEVNELQFEKGKPYQWELFSSVNDEIHSDTAIFELLPGNRKQSLMTELRELLKELNYDETAINYLIIAKFFEKNNLSASANRYYGKAITAALDVDEYFFTYLKFLEENGMQSKAERLYKQKQFSGTN